MGGGGPYASGRALAFSLGALGGAGRGSAGQGRGQFGLVENLLGTQIERQSRTHASSLADSVLGQPHHVTRPRGSRVTMPGLLLGNTTRLGQGSRVTSLLGNEGGVPSLPSGIITPGLLPACLGEPASTGLLASLPTAPTVPACLPTPPALQHSFPSKELTPGCQKPLPVSHLSACCREGLVRGSAVGWQPLLELGRDPAWRRRKTLWFLHSKPLLVWGVFPSPPFTAFTCVHRFYNDEVRVYSPIHSLSNISLGYMR